MGRNLDLVSLLDWLEEAYDNLNGYWEKNQHIFSREQRGAIEGIGTVVQELLLLRSELEAAWGAYMNLE